MWTDLTTLQTVTVLADQLGCGERSLSSNLCTLPFSTALSISYFVVQNHRTDNYTDTGERLNTRGGNGALTTDCNTRQAPSMKNPKRLDSIHNRRWLIQCKHQVPCTFHHKHRNRYKIQLQQTDFWEPTDNRMETLNRQMWLKFKIGFMKPLCEFIQKRNNAWIGILNCLYN